MALYRHSSASGVLRRSLVQPTDFLSAQSPFKGYVLSRPIFHSVAHTGSVGSGAPFEQPGAWVDRTTPEQCA